MKNTLSLGLEHILFALFIIIWLFCSLLYIPLFFLVGVFTLSLLYPGKKTYWALVLSISFIFSLMSISINPMGNNIGDVVVYYNAFINKDFIDTLLNLKIYRFLIFQLQYIFDLPVKVYSLISISLIYILYSIFYFNFLKVFSVYVKTFKDKVFFLLVLLSSIPFFIFSSFENTLSFVFFANGFLCYLNRKKLSCYALFLLSFLTHGSSVILAIIFILSTKVRNISLSLLFILSSIMLLFIYFFSFISAYVEIPFVGFYFLRLNYYLTGPWSSYIGLLEYFLFLIALFKMFILSVFIKDLKLRARNDSHIIILKFFFFYLTFCLLFISSRTLNLRYIYIGFLIILPYAFIYLQSNTRVLYRKVIIYSYFTLSIFSLHNIYYFYGIMKVSSFAPEKGVFSSVVDFVSSDFDLPEGRYIIQSRTERVESSQKSN